MVAGGHTTSGEANKQAGGCSTSSLGRHTQVGASSRTALSKLLQEGTLEQSTACSQNGRTWHFSTSTKSMTTKVSEGGKEMPTQKKNKNKTQQNRCADWDVLSCACVVVAKSTFCATTQQPHRHLTPRSRVSFAHFFIFFPPRPNHFVRCGAGRVYGCCAHAAAFGLHASVRRHGPKFITRARSGLRRQCSSRCRTKHRENARW